jgi:hypothetical protein
MNSSAKVVTKILIDYDQYLKLKSYERQVQELDAKKTDDLKIVKEKDDPFPAKEQTGDGLNLSDDFIERLSTTISNQISQKFNLNALQQLLPAQDATAEATQQISQVGEGTLSNDLQPPIPSAIELDVSQPPAFDAVNKKSQQYDKFDDNKLIHSVPKRFQRKATILLDNIKENPLEIDFNTKGDLFIDGVCIPNADIFKIFPELYVRKVKRKLPGKDELVTKIAAKGWGKFIVRGIIRGLKRPPQYQLHEDTVSSTKKFKNWWYLSM